MKENFVSDAQCIRFLHPVGRSTLLQGLTVPVSAQVSWLANINKGEKVAVEIRFAQKEAVQASLRRINNAVGHLQFRYETQNQSRLREYLMETFGKDSCQPGAVLEIVEIEPHVFLFTPIFGADQVRPKLSLYKPHFHNLDRDTVTAVSEFFELQECLNSVDYNADYSQSDYNGQIANVLLAAGWRSEARILKEIGLRCDFEKNGVWLEVEFGNARTYYQDYIKFLLAWRYQKACFSVLLCPTDAFAQLLCELGQQRAAAKYNMRGKIPKYSGMMSYEKAVRELPFLEFMLESGIVIAGIDIQHHSA